jgi:hypothetical protein
MPRPELIQTDKEWRTQKDFNFWRRLYNKVFFETPEGQAVFHDLLKELYYFKAVTTEEEKYLNNFAKRLLSWCGELSMTMDPPNDCILDKFGYPAAPDIKNLNKKEDTLNAMLSSRKR